MTIIARIDEDSGCEWVLSRGYVSDRVLRRYGIGSRGGLLVAEWRCRFGVCGVALEVSAERMRLVRREILERDVPAGGMRTDVAGIVGCSVWMDIVQYWEDIVRDAVFRGRRAVYARVMFGQVAEAGCWARGWFVEGSRVGGGIRCVGARCLLCVGCLQHCSGTDCK